MVYTEKNKWKVFKKPQELRKFIGRVGRVLVTWDAPLAFNPEYGLSDRPIDCLARRFFASQNCWVKNSCLAFCQCCHWTISCHTLGWPFRYEDSLRADPDVRTELLSTTGDLKSASQILVAEVHPTVALAVWWLEAGKDGNLPKYKGKGIEEKKLEDLLEYLRDKGMPDCSKTVGTLGDRIDAWIAFKMGEGLLLKGKGETETVGDAESGYYVLPKGSQLSEFKCEIWGE
jgi:hypothetical protein